MMLKLLSRSQFFEVDWKSGQAPRGRVGSRSEKSRSPPTTRSVKSKCQEG